jgi:two-component system phosphate regulon sensor histidine kinase PhoR
MSLVVIFTSEVAQKFYKSEVENKLKSLAYSVEFYTAEVPHKTDDFLNRIAKKYAEMYNKKNPSNEKIRITFIDLSGIVKGDSEADYLKMENHSGRIEVKEAIKGDTGVSIRRSETLGVNLLYLAVPFDEYNVILRIAVPLAELSNINNMIWFYSILTILFGLLITIFISLKMSETIIRPIKDFNTASKEISKGNYSKRITIRTKDELSELADSYNEMAATLDRTIFDLNYKKIELESIVDSLSSGIVAVDSFDKIILINPSACGMFDIAEGKSIYGDNIAEHIRNNQINSLLKDTIDKNKAYEKEIIENGRLLNVSTCPFKQKGTTFENSGAVIFIQDITRVRKLEELKTEFVSNVTHELKTPITSIRGFIETLKAGSISNKEVATKFLNIIDVEAERLNSLIDDILQLSEIENKTEDTDVENVNLKDSIDDVYEIMKKDADNKGINLINNVDESISMNMNKNRMKELFLNLVDNSIKYNIIGGSITIDAHNEEGKTIISVRDTGIGIPKEHIGRIFERFYRVDKGRSRDMGGTGLGLSIVKHIVGLYSGDISVNSEVGKGTEFMIQIPF